MKTILLLHGFPHTPRLWDLVAPTLAETYRVVAPDLVAGADAQTLAGRLARELSTQGAESAVVVAIDAAVPAAVVLALTRPELVERLVVMESLLGRLPGAEPFLAGGPPWWFGFHQAVGLPETVLQGHEREYVEWFLRNGTHDGRGFSGPIAEAFAAAYTGRDRLAAAFEHYRVMPANADVLVDLTARHRLTMPTLAIGADPVGPALAAQLDAISDDLTSVQLDDCGHLVPLDAPDRLLALLEAFLVRA
jgi:pimeloyl-ACP methyl ester carboxylesterase